MNRHLFAKMNYFAIILIVLISKGSLGGAPIPAWLSKVMKNPLYARLVQHIQEQQQRQAKISPPAPPDWHRRPPSNHVYGRVLHYPHEAGHSGRLCAPAVDKTLDKLRELAHQQRDSQPTESNDINKVEQPPADSDDSNKIASSWRTKPTESDTEATRNRFVYGIVLLRPNQKLDEARQRQRTLGVLKQLSAPVNQPQAGELISPRETESFGYIVASPPNQIDAQVSARNMQQITDDNEHLPSRWPQISPIDRLRERLGAADSDTRQPEEPAAGSRTNPNEDRHQGHTKTVAPPPPPNTADEFEGSFFSKPFEKAEVRLTDPQENRQPAPQSATSPNVFID